MNKKLFSLSLVLLTLGMMTFTEAAHAGGIHSFICFFKAIFSGTSPSLCAM